DGGWGSEWSAGVGSSDLAAEGAATVLAAGGVAAPARPAWGARHRPQAKVGLGLRGAGAAARRRQARQRLFRRRWRLSAARMLGAHRPARLLRRSIIVAEQGKEAATRAAAVGARPHAAVVAGDGGKAVPG